MKRRALPIVLLCLLPGSGTADNFSPDTSGILRLVGRFSFAHACPIASDTALTNAHVLDSRPFDRQAPLLPSMWSDGQGRVGILHPDHTNMDRDIAVAHGEFPQFYKIGKRPVPGDRVWFIGYNLSGKRILETKLISSKVERVVAGHVVYSPGGQPGSSGSCVLNQQGEVVAINAFTVDEGQAGLGVGVWAEVFEARR